MKQYYQDSALLIRSMLESDIDAIYQEFLALGWHPNQETYAAYYRQQILEERTVFVAVYQGQYCGYVTLRPKAEHGPFAKDGVPEICDFNVLPLYRKRGIGSKPVSYTHLDVYKRQAGCSEKNVRYHASYDLTPVSSLCARIW